MEDWLSHPGLMMMALASSLAMVAGLSWFERRAAKRRQFIVPRARKAFVDYIMAGWHPDAAASEVCQQHDVSLRELSPRDAVRVNLLVLGFAESRWRSGTGFKTAWEVAAEADRRAGKQQAPEDGAESKQDCPNSAIPEQGNMDDRTAEPPAQDVTLDVDAASLHGRLMVYGFALVGECPVQAVARGSLETVLLAHRDAGVLARQLTAVPAAEPWCIAGPNTDGDYTVKLPLRVAEIMAQEKVWPTCPTCARSLILQRTHQIAPVFWWECSGGSHLKVHVGTDANL